MINHWNYRIIEAEEGEYNIYEVYYDVRGNIDGILLNPEFKDGFESVEQLKDELKIMLDSCDEPVINSQKYQGLLRLWETTPEPQE